MEIISLESARSLGLKRYFTGKPCKRGHISFRFTASKGCAKCSYELARRLRRVYFEKEQKRRRSYYWANAERLRAAARAWSKANIKRKLASNYAWRKANVDKHRIHQANWRKANPESAAAHSRNRKARVRNAAGSHSATDIADIFKMQRGKCAYCRCSLAQAYHVDHIIPLSGGGSNDRKNIQLLCQSCNLSKGPKHPVEFVQSLGRLL